MGFRKIVSLFVTGISLSVFMLNAGAAPVGNAQTQALASSDPKKIAKAIEGLRKRGNPAAVKALSDRILSGLPPQLVESAIDAIAFIGKRAASKTLPRFADHRMASVRVKVVEGLADMRAPTARRIATDMLDDADPTVRGAAVRAIGKLGARPDMALLLKTVRLGLPEAGKVVAGHASQKDVKRILKQVNRDSLEAFAPVLLELIQRKRLPKESKMGVVKHLGKIATPLSRQTLLDFIEVLPRTDPVLRACVKTLNEMKSSGAMKSPAGSAKGKKNGSKAKTSKAANGEKKAVKKEAENRAALKNGKKSGSPESAPKSKANKAPGEAKKDSENKVEKNGKKTKKKNGNGKKNGSKAKTAKAAYGDKKEGKTTTETKKTSEKEAAK